MDISKYKQQGFSNWQIEEIKQATREGLTSIDIEKWIAKAYYGADQMREIRLGLLAGIDVSTYAKEGIPSDEMRHIREKLLAQKEISDDEAVKEEKQKERLEISERRAEVRLSIVKAALIFVPVLVAIVLLSITAFYGSELIGFLTSDLYIELTADTITLEVGDVFMPENYIEDYTEGDDITISLPSLDTTKIGTYQVEYLISNEFRTKRQTLEVEIVDTIAPVITLSADTITLTAGDEFVCGIYYEVSDNYDSDVDVSCASLSSLPGEYEVIITATDSSGNTSSTILQVVIVENNAVTEGVTSSGSSSNDNSEDTTSESSQSTIDSGSTLGEPYISGQLSYSVPVGTSTDDFVWLVSSSITASSNITISFSQVNLYVAGTYTFTIRTADGASATGTVIVY